MWTPRKGTCDFDPLRVRGVSKLELEATAVSFGRRVVNGNLSLQRVIKQWNNGKENGNYYLGYRRYRASPLFFLF